MADQTLGRQFCPAKTRQELLASHLPDWASTSNAPFGSNFPPIIFLVQPRLGTQWLQATSNQQNPVWRTGGRTTMLLSPVSIPGKCIGNQNPENQK